MAVYKDENTAMIIFAKAPTKENVETPNTINPDGSGTPYNPPSPNTPDVPSSPEEAEKGTGFSRAKQLVVGLGVLRALKTGVNYYKNNYGDIMQDSNKQVEINEAMNLINMGLGIATGFAVGGVIGGLASIGATGVNVGLEYATWNRTMHRNQVQSEIMMARTNYASINGGR